MFLVYLVRQWTNPWAPPVLLLSQTALLQIYMFQAYYFLLWKQLTGFSIRPISHILTLEHKIALLNLSSIENGSDCRHFDPFATRNKMMVLVVMHIKNKVRKQAGYVQVFFSNMYQFKESTYSSCKPCYFN